MCSPDKRDGLVGALKLIISEDMVTIGPETKGEFTHCQKLCDNNGLSA